MKISIITPVYNGEKYVRDCIESVEKTQSFSTEHIIIDDGSQDNTEKIVSEYSSIKYFRQERKGATRARNLGLKYASGEYIKFLDSDDILVNGSIEKQYQISQNLSKKNICYGYSESFSSSNSSKIQKRIPEQLYEPRIADLILRNISISLPLYPKEALSEVGGFDERMNSRQEWSLNLKLAAANYKFKYFDIFTFRQRYHDGPLRISNRKLEVENEMENINFAFETIQDLNDPRIVNAWAAYIFGVGRQFNLSGNSEAARFFFKEARGLSDGGYKSFFSKKYKFVMALFGPVWADKIFKYLVLPNK